jgi:dienelactone hydrolase
MHFFIEQTKIDLQPSAYGPVPGAENTQYRITSTFNLNANAKAFACQGGSILVLPSTDPLLVNVILKPDSGLAVSMPPVKYYIYRGLRKDSFFNGDSIIAAATSNSDFITTLWQTVAKFRLQDPALEDPSAVVLGYFPGLPDVTDVEKLFSSVGSLNLPKRIGLNKVNEGDWLGDFDVTAGFEIVTDLDHKGISLGNLQKTAHVLDVASFPATTPAEKLTLQMEKEKILQYIDPAAFWGLHFKTGMYVYDAAGEHKRRKITHEDIYTELINKYLTKNRVYLDVRSERGFSYNFYGNYGDSGGKNLRFRTSADENFSEFKYGAAWPIFSNDYSGAPPPILGNFIFQLRVDDNTQPLLFIENVEYFNDTSKSHFIRANKLLNDTATDWTKEVKLPFYEVNDPAAGTFVFISTYLRVYYGRRSDAPSPKPFVFNATTSIGEALGDVGRLNINTGNAFNYWSDNKWSIVNGFDFSFIAKTGIFYNQQLVLLYSKSLKTVESAKQLWPAIDTGNTEKLLIESPLFPREIVFQKWKLKNIPNAVEMDSLQIAGTNSRYKAYTDSRFFLGLLRSEFEALSAVSGFHPVATRYLVFEKATLPFTDSTGLSYSACSLKVRGYNPEGTALVTLAPATPVMVFTLDHRMFFSKAFAQQSPMPYTLPDPGTIQDFPAIRDQATNGGSYVPISDREFGSTLIVKPSILIRRNLFWPDPAGTGVLPAGITFPLVLIVHGNGHLFTKYTALAAHLARNGFFVAAVDCLQKKPYKVIKPDSPKHYFQLEDGTTLYFNEVDSGVYSAKDNKKVMDSATLENGSVILKDASGMGVLGREHVIAKHLADLQSHSLAAHMQFNNIGLIGHSRGGEAVVKVAGETGLIPAGCVIKSIISLAPTDMYDQANLVQSIPYFVLYGSRDGDVSGKRIVPVRNSGFSLYDRAINASEKAMAFIYGATHNGFITGNTTKELGDLGYPNGQYDKKVILGDAPQQHIAKAYMNAFLRMTLKAEAFWQPLFTGEQKPRTLQPANHKGIFMQYQAALNQRKSIDDFDTATPPTNDWKISTMIGGTVEGVLNDIDEESLSLPHQTRGLKIKWESGNRLVFHIPDPHKDITAYKYISFRIARSLSSKASLDDLRVELHDASKKIVYAKTNNIFLYPDFVIPAADRREDEDLTKEALMTVRIPLGSFLDSNINKLEIKALAFVFPKGSGKLALDNVEFTN